MTPPQATYENSTSKMVGRELFPLPFTYFESFQLSDERPGYPMTFVIQLVFTGCIEREPFERALHEALSRHPLLSARVVPWGKRWLAWTPSDTPPPVDWAPLSTPLSSDYGQPVDLRQRGGLSIWVRQGEARSEVLLQFHHASCDGIGGFRFVEDLLVAYARAQSGDDSVSFGKLDAERLLTRGYFGLVRPPFRERMRQTLYGVKEAIRFYRQTPQPLAIPDRPEKVEASAATTDSRAVALDAGGAGFVSRRFDRQQVAALRGRAAAAGATLNDLLLRDLFVTLREWNRTHDAERPNSFLRIVMPTSLRGREDVAMPAANMMSYSFLTRQAKSCSATGDLLEDLRWETAAVRKYRLSLYFIGMLGVANRWPLLMSRGLRSKRCFATAVMTNLGDPSRRFLARFPRVDGRVHVGNLILEDITGFPSLRPMTRAVFSIVTYARRLTIGTMCDPNVLDVGDARSLLDCYAAQLESTCG